MDKLQIDTIISMIRSLNEDEYSTSLTVENNWENLLLELNELQNKISDQKRRSNLILKNITECLVGDYFKKLPVSDKHDQLDSICLAFNTYVEEFEEHLKSLSNQSGCKIVESEKVPIKTSENKPIKVLIVEDNIINQMLISTILLKESYEVFMADDGKNAIEELAINEYDIILMDLMMPVMNGFETSEYIRTKMLDNKKNIPIIAVSADVTKDIKERCKISGMNDYISKPYTQKDLLDKIKLFVNLK